MSKFIKDWIELATVESEDYYIEVDKEWGNGWIRPKDHVQYDDKDYYKHNVYLTTHTFYGEQYQASTKLLRQYGFDVQLANWDEGE